MIRNAFLGNIETSRASKPMRLLEAKIIMQAGTRRYDFVHFDDRHFHISPVNWQPEEIEYSYQSPSGKHIEKVVRWKPYWHIFMDFAGRDKWLNLMNLIYHLTGSSHHFTETGVDPAVHFHFYPPGDIERPSIKVVMPSQAIEPKYIGRRYMGYMKFQITLMGDGSYRFCRPILPKMSRLIGKIEGGSLWNDSVMQSPELIIMD